MADDALTVTVTADTGSAVSGISNVEARLAALESAYVKTQTATEGHAAALGKSTIATRVESEAATGLGGALDALATHYRVVNAGTEMLGLEASGAAAKLAGLAEVLEGLEHSFAPLLVALAAFEVASKAFEFFKEGVDDAAALQSQMATLGAAITAQGGDWESAKEGISSFIESEQLASGYTTGQLVPALNQLVTAGNDVHDSQIMLGVAEELARAKHMEVGQATQLLIDAEAGRGKGLVKLDLNLKDVVNRHGKMSEALTILHRDMGGAITDSNTYEMQNARLKVVQEQLGEAIGKLVLPMLTNMATTMIGALKNAEDLGSGIGDVFSGIVSAVGHGAAAFEHFAAGMLAISRMDFAGAKDQFGSMAAQGKDALEGLGKAAQGTKKYFDEIFYGQDATARGHSIVNAAISEHNRRLGHISLDNDRNIQTKAPGAGGSGYSPTMMADAFESEDRATTKSLKALDPLVQLKNRLGVAEEDLRHKMEMSTDAATKNAIALDLKALKTKDAETYEKALNASVVSGTAAVVADTANVNSTRAAYESARNQLNEFRSSLEGKTKLTEADKQHEKELAAQVKLTEHAHRDAVTTLKAATASLNTHIAALEAARASVRKLADEETEAVAKIALKWNEFAAKQKQIMAEHLATTQMTNAQKAAYYYDMWSKINLTTAEGEAKAEQVWSKYQQAVLGNLSDMEKAHKAWVDSMTKQTATFISDVVIKHKSLKDELKSIYDEILKSFIDMVAKMIVESSLFGKITTSLGMGAPGSGGSSSSSNIFASLFGAGSAGSAPKGTPSDPLHVVTASSGSDFNKAMTGSPNGVDPSGGSSGLSSLGGNPYVAATLLSIGAGAALGNLQGGGSHTTWGEAGGLLGGLAGAFVGSFFGHKGPNAHDNPDQAGDPQGYGQFVTNFNGDPNGHFGNLNISAQSQYNPGLGGTPESQQLFAQLQAATAPGAGTPPQLLQEAQQLMALTNGDTNDPFNIKSEKNGMFTLASGAQVSVAQFQQMVSQFQTNGGGANGGPIPTFSISRDYPDPNASTLNSTGSINQNGIKLGTNVQVTVQGNVVGSGGINQLATTIGQILYQQQRGIQPGGGRTTLLNQNGGGF